MDDSNSSTPASGTDPSRPALQMGAWQPFTGSGIAAFAGAPAWRAGVWLLLACLVAGLSIAWVLRSAWWPVLAAAADEFPDSPVELRNGSLDWKGAQSRILAEAPKFAIALRTGSPAPTGRIADLQLELWPTEFRISGIAGFIAVPWPTDWNISLDRRDATAGWGAWKRPLLLSAGTAGAAANSIVAIALGLALTIPLWILGWILGRGISPMGTCRLVLVSTVAPSLCAATAILGYGLLWIPWPFLLAALGCHPAATLLLGVWGVLETPAATAKSKEATEARRGAKPSTGTNPFGPKGGTRTSDADGNPIRRKKPASNPFRR